MSNFALPDDTLRALSRRDAPALAEQSARGVGYVVDVQHIYRAPVVDEDARSREERAMAEETGRYQVKEDVTEELPDGRVIQVAAGGTELPLGEARRLGLLKDRQAAGPSETKLATERANEQAAEAMRQNTQNPKAEAPSVVRERAEREATQRAAKASQAAEERAAKDA